MSLWIK